MARKVTVSEVRRTAKKEIGLGLNRILVLGETIPCLTTSIALISLTHTASLAFSAAPCCKQKHQVKVFRNTFIAEVASVGVRDILLKAFTLLLAWNNNLHQGMIAYTFHLGCLYTCGTLSPMHPN